MARTKVGCLFLLTGHVLLADAAFYGMKSFTTETINMKKLE